MKRVKPGRIGVAIDHWKRYPPFSTQAMFGAGENGVLIDPSNANTLWQDVGQTLPIVGDGDVVKYVADLSGNGNDAVNLTDLFVPVLVEASRPYINYTVGSGHVISISNGDYDTWTVSVGGTVTFGTETIWAGSFLLNVANAGFGMIDRVLSDMEKTRLQSYYA